jgi:hypothetical protein
MKWIPIDSSAIRAIAYKPKKRRLYVRFVSGTDYVYAGVKPKVVVKFLFADSKGCFFHKHILDRYPYLRISR